jgi:hypothetical protein
MRNSIIHILHQILMWMIRWMGLVGQLREIRNAHKNFFLEAPCVFVRVILWHCQDLDCIASSGRVIDVFGRIKHLPGATEGNHKEPQ